jgi:Domain of unknown function (DUF4928)
MAEDRSAPEAIPVAYNPDLITWRFIRDLVKAAQERGQEAGVARHLVGALLHLAFPVATVDAPTSGPEGQTAPLGDYLVGDTVFHVILAPVMPIYDQCQKNIDQGFQVFLLVPDKYFCGTRQNAEIILPRKITVASIESYVSQSLERLAGFSKGKMGPAIRQLLATYNDRVKTLEADPSLMIAVPGILVD